MRILRQYKVLCWDRHLCSLWMPWGQHSNICGMKDEDLDTFLPQNTQEAETKWESQYSLTCQGKLWSYSVPWKHLLIPEGLWVSVTDTCMGRHTNRDVLCTLTGREIRRQNNTYPPLIPVKKDTLREIVSYRMPILQRQTVLVWH